MSNNPVIYEVNKLTPFEKPCYFITNRSLWDFEKYMSKHSNEWICYAWSGYIIDHKVFKYDGLFRYWSDGTVTER